MRSGGLEVISVYCMRRLWGVPLELHGSTPLDRVSAAARTTTTRTRRMLLLRGAELQFELRMRVCT